MVIKTLDALSPVDFCRRFEDDQPSLSAYPDSGSSRALDGLRWALGRDKCILEVRGWFPNCQLPFPERVVNEALDVIMPRPLCQSWRGRSLPSSPTEVTWAPPTKTTPLSYMQDSSFKMWFCGAALFFLILAAASSVYVLLARAKKPTLRSSHSHIAEDEEEEEEELCIAKPVVHTILFAKKCLSLAYLLPLQWWILSALSLSVQIFRALTVDTFAWTWTSFFSIIGAGYTVTGVAEALAALGLTPHELAPDKYSSFINTLRWSRLILTSTFEDAWDGLHHVCDKIKIIAEQLGASGTRVFLRAQKAFRRYILSSSCTYNRTKNRLGMYTNAGAYALRAIFTPIYDAIRLHRTTEDAFYLFDVREEKMIRPHNEFRIRMGKTRFTTYTEKLTYGTSRYAWTSRTERLASSSGPMSSRRSPTPAT
ncbi:hypothetical protein HGRIS_007355 [Hohenbuehelia grisea]|uniref:Uncharacterized protein n=1 Tax=Hohenbuehelia grisea TaxID=104357 RepID=A0ABR3J4W5_9AGAR